MFIITTKQGDEIIDWSKSSRDIFNLIRAICRPGPGADFKTIQEGYLAGNGLLSKHIGINGAVVELSDDYFVVKSGDTSIKITDYDYQGKILLGDRLG